MIFNRETTNPPYRDAKVGFIDSPVELDFLWEFFFYKAETLLKVSLWYEDHRKKMPQDSQWENPLFQTLFQNGACAKW